MGKFDWNTAISLEEVIQWQFTLMKLVRRSRSKERRSFFDIWLKNVQ